MQADGFSGRASGWRGGWVGCYVFGLLTVMVGLAAAEPAATNSQFTVRTKDGTALICKLAIAAVPFATSFAEMQIPLERIETVKLDADTNTATIALLNGDRLRGSISLRELKVSSLVGDLTIPLAVVTEISTMVKREPVYEDTPARRNQCINNLRQIDSAKEQCAMERRWANGTPVPDGDPGVNQYIRGNATPVCPAKGKYVYGAIGVNPTCSVPGHAYQMQ
jgi:hypothetical protein